MASVFSARSSPRISPIFLGLVLVTAAGGALTLIGTRIPVTAGVVILVLAGWAVSLCLHEFSHALVADRCGDHSVRGLGYLTLDIRRYANVGLTFVLPLLFLLIGGIPLPGGAVWIQRSALRSRAAASAVSIAGPLMNLLLAFVLALVVPFVPPLLGAGMSFLALIQVLAFILNILPIPGLDGWGVIDPYLLVLDAARRCPGSRPTPRWCSSGCWSSCARSRARCSRSRRSSTAPWAATPSSRVWARSCSSSGSARCAPRP